MICFASLNAHAQVARQPKLDISSAAASFRTQPTETLAARLSGEADAQARQAIVIALANQGAPAFEALKAALSDTRAEVRLEAVVGLGRIGSVEAVTELLAHLSREKTDGVRMSILYWLGETGYAPATDAAGGLLRDGNPHIRVEAAQMLGRIGTGKAKGLLRDAAPDKDARVRRVVDENKR